MAENTTLEIQSKIDDQVKEIEKIVEQYEEDVLGFPKIVKLSRPEILDMPLDSLRKKAPEELSECCIELSRYSINLRRIINKHKAWHDWAESKINEIVAALLPEIGSGYGWNERTVMARHNDARARRLNQISREAKMYYNRLYDMCKEIEGFTRHINDLKIIAMKREKDQERY